MATFSIKVRCRRLLPMDGYISLSDPVVGLYLKVRERIPFHQAFVFNQISVNIHFKNIDICIIYIYIYIKKLFSASFVFCSLTYSPTILTQEGNTFELKQNTEILM